MSAEIKRTADLTDNDYARAVAIITGDNNASTSYLQRTMQLGYNAAASLIERAEAEGIVSRPNAAGKREVTPAASTIATLTAQLAEARAMAGAAAVAGWNACRKSVYAICEDTMEDAYAKLKRDGLTDHERGFHHAEKFTAKSIARAFGSFEAQDDDNFRAIDPDASAALAEYVRPLQDEVKRLREAVTPSGDTKAAYMGEFFFPMTVTDEDGNEGTVRVLVPWDTIKEIMGAIRDRALLEGAKP